MKNILRIVLGLALCSQITYGQTAVRNPASNLWNDAEFVKEFTASYGVLTPYEPAITDAEKDSLRGLLNAIKSNPRSAITALEGQIKPSSSAAFNFILANLYFQQGNLNKAEQAYSKAVKKYPKFRRAHKNLGSVYIQSGKHAQAITAISRAVELGAVDGRSYGLLGYCYLTERQYYAAEAAYRQAILMQPKSQDWKRGLASCLVETQRYADAIALFDTLIQENPNDADFWLLQANALVGKGDTMAAARNIEIVRRMGAADVNSMTMLGDIYMNNNHPDLALSGYLEALKLSGNKNSSSLMRASKIFTQTGNFEQAKTMISQLRQQVGSGLSNEDDLSLLTLEAKIARAEGDNEKALSSLNMIVERDALNGEALIELGDYYASLDDMDRAVNRYEQAQLIAKYERQALIAHGRALVNKRNYSEALQLLKRALALQEDRYLATYVERVERAAK